MTLSLPIPIFYLAAGAFALFSMAYLAIAGSIIYHLRTFSLPGRTSSYIISTVFMVVSGLLWIIGLIFLFRLPR
ncbi:MAG: hypothetical protein HY617_00845 [Candidatus Sungbacteria bacterium]|nr:hypothetical protein [Candidatus Sungbacteria bacterium]